MNSVLRDQKEDALSPQEAASTTPDHYPSYNQQNAGWHPVKAVIYFKKRVINLHRCAHISQFSASLQLHPAFTKRQLHTDWDIHS